MSDTPGTSTKVLIADADAFEAGYVAESLRRTGMDVAGPLQTGGEVLAVLGASPAPQVVVLAAQLRDGCPTAVLGELRRRGIRHMVLIGSDAEHALGDLTETPVLAKPFAAYQVADWIQGAVDEPLLVVPAAGSGPAA
jgi:CheY-like chemotaxis protein